MFSIVRRCDFSFSVFSSNFQIEFSNYKFMLWIRSTSIRHHYPFIQPKSLETFNLKVFTELQAIPLSLFHAGFKSGYNAYMSKVVGFASNQSPPLCFLVGY